jgi:pyridoxal phosphate enzyme (YggS family)
VTAGSRADVLANLATIRDRLARACDVAGRAPTEVRIVAAAKTVDAERIRWVVEAGVEDVGENYVRELRAMHPEIPGARWHFIGTLQTNTSHHVAAVADVVQTLASPRSAARLARRAATAGRTLDGLIEVDFTGVRSGVAPEATLGFADEIAALDGVRFAGLMTLPPASDDPEDARAWFVRLRELGERLRREHPEATELSMGMSLDYTVAVEEGATMVRIGTALFGPRTPQ